MLHLPELKNGRSINISLNYTPDGIGSYQQSATIYINAEDGTLLRQCPGRISYRVNPSYDTLVVEIVFDAEVDR